MNIKTGLILIGKFLFAWLQLTILWEVPMLVVAGCFCLDTHQSMSLDLFSLTVLFSAIIGLFWGVIRGEVDKILI